MNVQLWSKVWQWFIFWHLQTYEKHVSMQRKWWNEKGWKETPNLDSCRVFHCWHGTGLMCSPFLPRTINFQISKQLEVERENWWTNPELSNFYIFAECESVPEVFLGGNWLLCYYSWHQNMLVYCTWHDSFAESSQGYSLAACWRLLGLLRLSLLMLNISLKFLIW